MSGPYATRRHPPDGPILVADIGSTNARFAIALPDGTLTEVRRYPVVSFVSGEQLVSQYLTDAGAPSTAGASLALAGPLHAGAITLVNAPLTFEQAALRQLIGSDRVQLINDFVAVAHAVPDLPDAVLRPLGAGEPFDGVKAALGPGTGLGMGILVPVEDSWRVLASEGGHAPLAPKNALELELLSVLMRDHEDCAWETVLCGPGLVRLYRAVCEVWGAGVATDEPAEVTRRALEDTDPVCHQTLETFCAMLGSAAGSLALTAGAEGGVYIAGGIAPRIYDFLAASEFRAHFDEHGALSEYCRRIRCFVIDDAALGLRGAFCAWSRAYAELAY